MCVCVCVRACVRACVRVWCTGLVGTDVYLCLCAGCHCVIVSPSVHTYVHRHVSVGVHCAVYIRTYVFYVCYC